MHDDLIGFLLARFAFGAAAKPNFAAVKAVNADVPFLTDLYRVKKYRFVNVANWAMHRHRQPVFNIHNSTP
nr:MAG TPA: hypothetical protein [Caudoviricetes sp.]